MAITVAFELQPSEMTKTVSHQVSGHLGRHSRPVGVLCYAVFADEFVAKPCEVYINASMSIAPLPGFFHQFHTCWFINPIEL